jgi:large subunit ribosomal protein L9
MKVILLKNIEKVGKKYEVKELSPGYVRNFLMPRGLAKMASPSNLEWLERLKNKRSFKAELELKKVQSLVSKIDGLEIEIKVKQNKKGKIFGSIGPSKIAEKLKDMGFRIKKSQIELVSPIKELGEYPVKISFSHGLEAEAVAIVSLEEGEREEGESL